MIGTVSDTGLYVTGSTYIINLIKDCGAKAVLSKAVPYHYLYCL